MRFSLMIVISLLSAPCLAKFSVVWWNVAGFGWKPQEMQISLQSLLQWPDLDVLILGESNLSSESADLRGQIQQRLPYWDFIYYPGNPRDGISVHSRWPLQKKFSADLSWGTPEQQQHWLQKYGVIPNPERTFNLYEVQTEGGIYLFSPLHLLNPWSSFQAKEGQAKTTWEIFWGKDNPHTFQTDQLLSQLRALQLSQASRPFLLVGDYNVPSSPMLAASLRSLGSQLKNLMKDTAATFPENRLKIDHAYGNAKAQRETDQVLALEGSDHFPIAITLH